MFLHSLGYDFFTIPKLTILEIRQLIAANNEDVADKEKEARRQKQIHKYRSKR